MTPNDTALETPAQENAEETRVTPPRPLKVCHLAYTFYEGDNRVMRYAELLARLGATVDVLGLRRKGQSRRDIVNGVKLTRLQRRTVNEGPAWVYLLKLVWFMVKSSAVLTYRHLRQPYDVIHVHNVPDFLVFATLVPRLTGALVLLDIHDILPELYAGKFGRSQRSLTFRSLLLAERVSCRFAHHVIVANHLWQERLATRAVARDKVTTLLNHPDSIFFAERQAASASHGFLFLYPGSLNYHQGLDLAVEAFAAVADDMPAAQLHIYGEGPERRRIEAQIEALGMSGRIRVRDKIPLASIPALMATAHCGVVPKRASGFGDEAFSTKVLEFMASRVPVIVTCTTIDRYYFDDTCVTFAEPDDVASLAAAMSRLYREPDVAAAQARRGHDVATKWSWQVHSAAYTSLIAAALRNHGPERQRRTP